MAVFPARGAADPNGGGAAPIPIRGTRFDDDFARQVRDALRHLYDPVYLRTHPLTRWLRTPAAFPPASAGDALRRCLMDAIAAVQPGPEAGVADRSGTDGPGTDGAGADGAGRPVGNRAWRRHRLLVLRYLDGHEVPAVCAQLAISRREYERAHREALDAVVSELRRCLQAGADASAEVPQKRGAEAGAEPSRGAPVLLSLPTRLPVPLTSFVGREREVDDVVRLLETARLVTLTGPAGVGKTRLALQVARRLSGTGSVGAVFVPLAAVGQPDLVLPVVARALGVHEPAAVPLADGVRHRLGSASLLLVLDNFEQVLAAAPAVADLLAANGGLRVLATSRAALRISGEQEYPLAPLPAAGSASGPEATDAVRLFVERARAVRPDFMLTPDTAAAVAGVCQRLDGLPLAIELAAARLRLFPPAALLARLEAAAGGLALLAGGPQDAPARHQTLHAAIDWSYDLLTPQEQVLFRRLGVFAGGFTLEAAEAVCADEGEAGRTNEASPVSDAAGPSSTVISAGEVLTVLESLVAQSLVQPQPPCEGEPRLGLLETIREFASERLDASGEADAIRWRHAQCYLALAQATAPTARTPQWLDAVEREYGNLEAALWWLAAQPDIRMVEQGQRLAEALAFYWRSRGRLSEGRRHLALLLARPAPPAPSVRYLRVRAVLISQAGQLALLQGDHTTAWQHFEAALALRRQVGRPAAIAGSLRSLAAMAYEQGDYARARACIEEAQSILRAAGQPGRPRFRVGSLNLLGRVAQEQGDDVAAGVHHTQALALARELGLLDHVPMVLNDLGRMAWRGGDFAGARTHHAQALALAREWGDRRAQAAALDHLGRVALSQGNADEAARCHTAGLALAWEFGDRVRVAWCLEGLAAVTATQADGRPAARLFGTAAALRNTIGAPLPPSQRAWHGHQLAAAHATLTEAAFAAAWDEGRTASLELVVTRALEG